MKKLRLLVMPLMAVSFLINCGGNSKPVDVTHKFTFHGINCKINGDSEYSHDIYENDKNVKYTIVPNTGYELPKTIDSDILYNNKTGVITISEIKSDIELRVEANSLPPIPDLKHKIYLDAGGGQFGEGQLSILENIEDGDTIPTKPILVREGYNVDEVVWLINDSTTDEFTFGPKGIGTEVREDYFLHAKWGNLSSYSITIKGEHIIETSTTFNHNDFRPIYEIIKEESGYNLVNNYVVVDPMDAADASYSDKHTLQIIPKRNVDNIIITLRAEEAPERDYYNVFASGEHIHYYKDENMIMPLESVKAKKSEDFTFYMLGEEEVTENSEGYVPPTSLDVKIDDILEDNCYSIESVTGEYANLMKKVTITASYVTGDIDIQGDGVRKDYYQINFPYLIGLKQPEIQNTFFEYDKPATFEFVAENTDASNDELLTSINVLVNLDGDGENWINPGEYGSGNDVTFEHNTTTDKYYLHIKENTVSDEKNVIKVAARAKKASILNALSWEEISRASDKGFATMLFDIGETKNVKINGVIHEVRIIDFNKDLLSSSTKRAGITFEFVNVIASFNVRWNSNDGGASTNYDFINNSSLNDCLQPATSEKPVGKIYEMMPPELMNVIKTVNKNVDIYSNGEWIDDDYDTQLFPLSCGEISGNIDTSYQYYKGADNNTRKKTEPGKSQIMTYWLRSPDTGNNSFAWGIANNGPATGEVHSFGLSGNTRSVAPAFCI